MPSAFAHALIGASLATIVSRARRPAWFAAVLALLAAAPDLDVVAFRLGIPYDHPLGHRGLSHSLFFAAAVSLLSIPIWRRLLPAQFRSASALTFLAVASHGILDTFTDAGRGIGLLMPFDNARYFAPWRPILTSPLSVSGFFTARGLDILRNELLWVGLPTLFLLAVMRGIRKSRERPADVGGH